MLPDVFLTFAVSLLFLIASANFLVKSVERFAAKIKLSPLIIGATLIAAGTSLPETFVTFSALAQNAAAISLGNIVGSNIGNLAFILGLAILLFPMRVGTEKTQRNNFLLVGLTVFFSCLFFLPEGVRKLLSLLLFGFYAVFLVTEIVWGKVGHKKEDQKALSKMEKGRGRPVFYFAGISFSLLGLILSSKYLVTAALGIAKDLAIDPEVVGLSLVALGTSLPELVTTIVSGIQKDWKLMYGDIQGSNIFNLSLTGAVALIAGGSTGPAHLPSLYYLLGITLAIFILTSKFKGTHIPRIYGLFFLLSYTVYLFFIYRGF